MPSISKHLKELESLKPKEELSPEKKLDFIEKQLEGFQTQAWRFQIDVEVAKEYMRAGKESGNEEAYIATGEKNIVEATQALRSIVINIEKLCQLREEIKAKYELQSSARAEG